MKKFIIIIVVCLVLPISLFSQHDMQTSLYADNKFLINPANTGDKNFSPYLMGGYRNNFSGLAGALRRPFVAYHSPITTEASLGALVSLEQEGVFEYYTASGSYSYAISFTRKDKLRLGFSSGIYSRQINQSKIKVDNATDVNLQNDYFSKVSYFGGLGAEYSTESWAAGLSVPKLYSGEDKVFAEKAIGSFEYTIKDDQSKYIPSVYVNYSRYAPLRADLNLIYKWKDVFYALGSVRSDFSGAVGGGINLAGLTISYVYDYTAKLTSVAPSTHEVMLTYEFEPLRRF